MRYWHWVPLVIILFVPRALNVLFCCHLYTSTTINTACELSPTACRLPVTHYALNGVRWHCLLEHFQCFRLAISIRVICQSGTAVPVLPLRLRFALRYLRCVAVHFAICDAPICVCDIYTPTLPCSLLSNVLRVCRDSSTYTRFVAIVVSLSLSISILAFTWCSPERHGAPHGDVALRALGKHTFSHLLFSCALFVVHLSRHAYLSFYTSSLCICIIYKRIFFILQSYYLVR